MEFDYLAAAAHEGVGNGIVHHREIELVGLDAVGAFLPFESGLDEPALIGLEDIALVHDLVELSCLHSLSEYEIETEEYERGYAAGRKSLQPQWISTEDHQPGKDGIYFAVIESEDGSFSIGLYEMFAGGSWLIDRKRKVRYWAEQSSYDLPEELLRKGIA